MIWKNEYLNETVKREEFKKFVFIGNDSKPYAVMMLDGSPWLCYWNEGYKCFTTLRRINQSDVFSYASIKLPEEQADLYFNYGK